MKFGELTEEDKYKVFKTRVHWPIGGVFFLMATMQVPYQLVNIVVIAGIWLYLFFFGLKNPQNGYNLPQLLKDSVLLVGIYTISTFLYAPLASSGLSNTMQEYWSYVTVALSSGAIIYLVWFMFIKIQSRVFKDVNWKVKSVL